MENPLRMLLSGAAVIRICDCESMLCFDIFHPSCFVWFNQLKIQLGFYWLTSEILNESWLCWANFQVMNATWFCRNTGATKSSGFSPCRNCNFWEWYICTVSGSRPEYHTFIFVGRFVGRFYHILPITSPWQTVVFARMISRWSSTNSLWFSLYLQWFWSNYTKKSPWKKHMPWMAAIFTSKKIFKSEPSWNFERTQGIHFSTDYPLVN